MAPEILAHALGATEGTAREVPGCPGLRLAIDELWTIVDRLEPAFADDASSDGERGS